MWAICSTCHTVLKASPGAAFFGRDMLFDIPFLADWNKIGDHRQCQTDLNTECENCSRRDWDYKVDAKVLLRKDGIIRKSEGQYECDPWTITSVHTNEAIRFNADQKSKQLIIRRVTPFLTIRLNSHKCYFLWVFSLSYTTLMRYLIHDRLYSLSCHSRHG